MLTWPRADGDFGVGLPDAEQCLATIAATVSLHQSVVIVTEDSEMSSRVSGMVAANGGEIVQLSFVDAAANDIWARDHGPISIVRDEITVALDFVFDGWGQRHDASRDNAINGRLRDAGVLGNLPGDFEFKSVNLILEGGAIDSDGAGTLLTTARCLFEAGRNPGMGEREYQRKFSQLFDTKRIISLKFGEILGDETDGHVDMLARFTAPDTIAYQSCDDPGDAQFDPLQALGDELNGLTTLDGMPYQVVPLPFPDPQYDADGTRLPASYANFLICNCQVLVPAYHCASDEVARQVLADLFPDRNVVSIDCRALIAQGGSLHCATMQIPFGGKTV